MSEVANNTKDMELAQCQRRPVHVQTTASNNTHDGRHHITVTENNG